MATWKKVIVSGSTANLAALQVDNLTSGQVVIGGGTSNLSTTAINGTGTIVATTGASGLVHSGSFSGSFQGTFTGLITSASQAATASYVTSSNVFGPFGFNSILSASYAASSSQATTASFALTTSQTQNTLTFGEGLSTGTFNGSSNVTVQVSGAVDLTNNAITKWNNTDNKFANSSLTDNGTVISGVSSIQLSGAASSLTGSFTGSFSGSFSGNGAGLTGVNATAVFPTNQVTNIVSADKFFISQSTGQEYITYGNLLTDLAGTNLVTESNDSLTLATTITGLTTVTSTGFTGSLQGTSSWASNAVNASLAATASNIFPAIVGSNADNNILTATGGGTINGESALTFDGTTLNVNGNATITGNLSVAGTASFTNTDNLNIKDKFILINSGSTSLADSGWITQYNAAGSGSAFYLEAGTANDAGPYGRFAVAFDAIGTSTALTPSEYVVTAKINQISAPTTAVPPTWGTGSSGAGNMWIMNNAAGDIYIYS
jgi:hypothetical protein